LALFPFKPLEDHFFGILIGNVWKATDGDFDKLNRAIHSRLVGDLQHYTCTPKGDKIVLMNIYPNQFRKYIETNQPEKLYTEFEKLITAKIPETIARLDVAMDLLEWLFTGFPEHEHLAQNLLAIITNKQISFKEEFWLKLKEEYYNPSHLS
jgi:hypothetical protein